MEEALLESWAAQENEIDELELESAELEPLDFSPGPGLDPAPALRATVEPEVTQRSSPPRKALSPGPVGRPPQLSPSGKRALKSPTLRAVRATLGSVRPVSGPSPEAPSASEAPRVFLELSDPSRDEAPPAGTELGEDSVWLEFGEPGLSEETTERSAPEVAGRATPDVVGDGGAVRVDLSLGTKEAPDLEQSRRAAPDGGGVRSQLGNPAIEPSAPADLLTYSGDEIGEPEARQLEDEATDRGLDWEEP
jgi:hypothetical protein